MNGGYGQEARVLIDAFQDQSLAKLHELIGDKTLGAHTFDNPIGGITQRHHEGEPSPLRNLTVEDVIRPINPALYNPTPASAKYADDWNETNALHDAAWDRYTRHKDRDEYKRDCAEINGRSAA